MTIRPGFILRLPTTVTKVGFFQKAKYEAAKLLYGQYPPLGAINYIWESKSPIGTVVPKPLYRSSTNVRHTKWGR